MKPARSFVLVAAAALALTACGSSSSSKRAAESQLGAIESAVAQGANSSGAPSSDPSASSDSASSGESSSSGSPATSGTGPADVDVCALLTPADANAVAHADQLDSAQTASTVYTLMAAKDNINADSTSNCRFTISDQAQEGTVLFVIQPGSTIDEFSDGTKVAGLGDEAYTNSNGGTVVRVGGLLLNEGDDALSSAITLDLLRRMAPRLK